MKARDWRGFHAAQSRNSGRSPAAIGNGSWDVKIVLGEAAVRSDGSAFFTLPARTPVYFQAIDARGYAVQTMRSWLTLQPGGNVSCVGCHESKNSTPPGGVRFSLAMKAGVQDLTPFHGPPRGFSFPREIQPILDRHCVGCHKDTQPRSGEEKKVATVAAKTAFSLLGTPVPEPLAKRRWSVGYLALVQATEQMQEGHRYLAGVSGDLVNWVSAQSGPEMLSPYAAGAARSRLLPMLAEGHCDVRMTPEEIKTLACWIDLQVPFCGDYEEADLWTPEDQSKYRHFLEKRRRMEDLERRNIAEWVRCRVEID